MSGLSVISRACADHAPSRVFALFSGGHDSLVSTHVAAQYPRFSGVVHVNTGIGIEETRRFVRDTCERHGWPLLEYHPDAKTYEQLVAERGMPRGPQSHNTMYYWLKQRQIRRLVADHKQHIHDRIGHAPGSAAKNRAGEWNPRSASPSAATAPSFGSTRSSTGRRLTATRISRSMASPGTW